MEEDLERAGAQHPGRLDYRRIFEEMNERVIEPFTTGWVGAQLIDVDPDRAQAFGVEKGTGVIVKRLFPNSAAANSGLKVNDVITTVNGKTIERRYGDRHQFAIADRAAYTGVTAKWLHTKDPKPQKQRVKLKRKPKPQHLRALQHPKAKPVTAKKTAAKPKEAREGEYMTGEADNVFAITTVYASKAQAMRAALAKWDKLQRGVAEFSISLAMGRADLYPETPVAVKGFKRVIDEQAWTITKVTHSLSDSGYTTALELEVKLSDVEYEEEISQD